MRTCRGCREIKPLDQFWRCKNCYQQKDYFCAECRIRQKLKRLSTESGLYELHSRLITSLFKKTWFPPYDSKITHLDHVYSIRDGFNNNVPLQIINNRNNLKLTPVAKNLRKGSASFMSLEELYSTAEADEKLNRYCLNVAKILDVDCLLEISRKVATIQNAE